MTNDDSNALLYQRVLALIADCEYKPGYEIMVRRDQVDPDGRVYLQVRCWREDTFHPGDYDWGYGGKAYLSPHAVDSELVQTAFGLCKGYDEHEAREGFKYKGRRIFGPHIDVRALWDAAEHLDARPLPERTHDDGTVQQDQEDVDRSVSTGTGTTAAEDDRPSSGQQAEPAVVELSIPDSWHARPLRLADADD